MRSISATMFHNRIARLMGRSHDPIPGRPWSTVSGRLVFQGGTLVFDSLPRERARIHSMVAQSAQDNEPIMIWEPRGGEKPPIGFPKPLHRGWTLTTDGAEIVLFQRVVFAGLSIITVPAETQTGRFITANPYHVSAWDGAVQITDHCPS